MYRNFLVATIVITTSAWADTVIYSTVPSPLPPNSPSLGYEATSTQEFGDLIQFSGASLNLTGVTVGMSNWAYESEWEPLGTSTGFNIPLTLNLYNVGAGDTVGSMIATQTIDAFIPWRPEPTPGTCAPGSNNDYLGSDGQCYAGSNSTVSFDFTGTTVPDEIIYGLAYNTTDYGYNPTGVPGPDESLNFALATVPPTVGSNPLPDTAYWNTSFAGNYADGGAAGVGIFRQDQEWTPYSGIIQFDATSSVPEPRYSALAGGIMLLGLLIKKMR
jgi:hypothetical protein